MRFKPLLLILLLILTVTACTSTPPASPPDDPNDSQQGQNPPDNDSEPDPDPEPPFDFATYQPNELGRIPVFMYHNIGEPEAEWVRTADNFRNDLQRFYDAGFRLVSMTDVINDNIDIPAGTSPLVLTFDDGPRNNFNLIKDETGEIVLDPDSAVAIILDFAERNPEMGTAATFYLNFPHPFSQTDSWYTAEHRNWKLEQLVEWGMEIGNHTYTHPHLSRDIDSEEQLLREMGGGQVFIESVLPGYKMNSLALPFGSRPKEEWQHLAHRGVYEGVEYQHDIILLVGSHPAHPPNHRDYSPRAMPRIRASNYGGDFLDNALKQLESNRYISDGDPDTITIPETMKEYLDAETLGDKSLRVYDPVEFKEVE